MLAQMLAAAFEFVADEADSVQIHSQDVLPDEDLPDAPVGRRKTR
jgi:hypothetical protein